MRRLLHSVTRNHALINGERRTAWLAMRVFLRFNGVNANAVPPPVPGPFVEEVAQANIDVPVIAKRLAVWFPPPDVGRLEVRLRQRPSTRHPWRRVITRRKSVSGRSPM